MHIFVNSQFYSYAYSLSILLIGYFANKTEKIKIEFEFEIVFVLIVLPINKRFLYKETKVLLRGSHRRKGYKVKTYSYVGIISSGSNSAIAPMS